MDKVLTVGEKLLLKEIKRLTGPRGNLDEHQEYVEDRVRSKIDYEMRVGEATTRLADSIAQLNVVKKNIAILVQDAIRLGCDEDTIREHWPNFTAHILMTWLEL